MLGFYLQNVLGLFLIFERFFIFLSALVFSLALLWQGWKAQRLHYGRLWVQLQSQQYYWCHGWSWSSASLFLWAFYPYPLLLGAWCLWRWQALGRSWDLLPWFQLILQAPWALWCLLPALGVPRAGLLAALARHYLVHWREPRLRWLITFQVLFLQLEVYRKLALGLQKIAFLLRTHASPTDEGERYLRRYFFRLLLWPHHWQVWLAPLMILVELLVCRGQLHWSFYGLPVLGLMLALRRLLYHHLVYFGQEEAQSVYLYGGTYLLTGEAASQHLFLRHSGLAPLAGDVFPGRTGDRYLSLIRTRPFGSQPVPPAPLRWGFRNHPKYYEYSYQRRWFGQQAGSGLAPKAVWKLGWLLTQGKQWDPLVASWAVWWHQPALGYFLERAREQGHLAGQTLTSLGAWLRPGVPVRPGPSFQGPLPLTQAQIQDFLAGHRLSHHLGRPVLVVSPQDQCPASPLGGGLRAAIPSWARPQPNPDFFICRKDGTYAAALDSKVVVHRDHWKAHFLSGEDRYHWIYSLDQYLHQLRFQPLKPALLLSLTALGQDMKEALFLAQDNQAVDLWLRALEEGFFLHLPPPPLWLHRDQSLDHFLPEFREQMEKAFGPLFGRGLFFPSSELSQPERN